MGIFRDSRNKPIATLSLCLFLLRFHAAADESDAEVAVAKRIIGGYPVSRGESPFLVSLQLIDPKTQTGKHVCGASVIFNRFLLTAAHCVNRVKNEPGRLRALLGTLKSGENTTHNGHSHKEDSPIFRTYAAKVIDEILENREFSVRKPAAWKRNYDDYSSEEAETFKTEEMESSASDTAFQSEISKIYVHPKFNMRSTQNDIAVLVMADFVPDSFQKKVVSVNLPTLTMEEEGYPDVGINCTVFGWGLAHVPQSIDEWNQESSESVAKKVDVEVQNQSICTRFYRHLKRISNIPGAYNHSNSFCAGNIGIDEHRGIFKGDSGGPLICGYQGYYYQAGVVSFGSYELGAYSPAYFTRLTAYEDWINDVVINFLTAST